jgi:hypothetical protein
MAQQNDIGPLGDLPEPILAPIAPIAPIVMPPVSGNADSVTNTQNIQ